MVVNKVREGKGDFGYNARTEVYENLIAAGVIDPTKVTRVALQNAASAAAMILTNLEKLGLPYPKAIVINQPSQALAAAAQIGYPVVIKPNIGGSGAGIERFSSPEALSAAVNDKRLYFGIDSTALVQEAFTARDGIITRVEVIGGKFIYAIKIHITGDSFNLCPADICQNTKGEELTRIACPVDAPKTGMTVEGWDPPQKIIDEVERIMALGNVEVGGLEYVIDDRTGQPRQFERLALAQIHRHRRLHFRRQLIHKARYKQFRFHPPLISEFF